MQNRLVPRLLAAALLSSGLAWAEASPEPEAADAPHGAEAVETTDEEAPADAMDATEAAEAVEILDLAAAQAWALRENPSLQAAEERVEQARQRAAQARSRFFPTVQATAGVSKTWLDENTYRARRNQALMGPLQSAGSSGGFTSSQGLPVLSALGRYANALGTGINARGAVDDDITAYTGAVTAQWLLFDGFQREFDHAAARIASKASEAAYLEAKRQILSAVAMAYHAAALARENIRIAQADEAFNIRQLEDAQARRRVGTGSLSDELNFQVRVNSARAARIRAEENYEVARIALAELMSLPDGIWPEYTELAPLADEDPAELDIPAVDAKVEIARVYRPDLLQSELSLDRARKLTRSARGAFLPTLTASASRSAQQTDGWFGQDDFSTTVGLNASYTLFAGGRNRAEYLEAKSAEREAALNLATRDDDVAAGVREACENVTAAQKQLWLERANATFVQQNRDLVEKEYNAGQTSLVRLNEAQRDLIAAQASLALARVQLRQSWHDLRTATGETIAPYLDDSELRPEPPAE